MLLHRIHRVIVIAWSQTKPDHVWPKINQFNFVTYELSANSLRYVWSGCFISTSVRFLSAFFFLCCVHKSQDQDGPSHFSYELNESLQNIRGANGTLIRSQRVTVIFAEHFPLMIQKFHKFSAQYGMEADCMHRYYTHRLRAEIQR